MFNSEEFQNVGSYILLLSLEDIFDLVEILFTHLQ